MIGTLQKIYRIQNDKGIGPYRDSNIDRGLLSHHSDNLDDFPIPQREPTIKRGMYKNELCGFISLDQLFNWFTDKEIDTLATLGYHMVEVIGIVTAIGKKQILFMKEGTCSEYPQKEQD